MKHLRSKLSVLSILMVATPATCAINNQNPYMSGFGSGMQGGFMPYAREDQLATRIKRIGDLCNPTEGQTKLKSRKTLYDDRYKLEAEQVRKDLQAMATAESRSFAKNVLEDKVRTVVDGMVTQDILKNNILTQEEAEAGRAMLVRRMFRESSGLDVSDVVARGIAGENWQAIADLRSDGMLQAVGNVALYKGAEVFGKHLSQSIESSVGDWLDTIFGGTLGLVTQKVFDVWRTVRNQITGRTGLPFIGRELKLWRESINRLLGELLNLAKTASIMDARSRDKVLRDAGEDDEAEQVDPAWAGQRSSFGREFQFISNSIEKRSNYYDPEHDEAVVFYAEQLKSLLHDVKDNLLHKVHCHRDLGSSTVQSSLSVARNALDLYFYNLISLVAPRAAGERERDDANMSNMQPGMQNYSSTSFGGYGNTF